MTICPVVRFFIVTLISGEEKGSGVVFRKDSRPLFRSTVRMQQTYQLLYCLFELGLARVVYGSPIDLTSKFSDC